MYQYKAIITKVIDGDTVDVDIDLGFDVWLKNQRIRLYGIDTPESRTSDKVEKVFGNLAGKYGRILGELITDEGINVNTYLVENSYAVEYFGMSKEDIAQKQLDNRQIILERGEVTI
jgi:micrococcal nuclease